MSSGSPPPVVFWFKVYSGLLLWIYIACIGFGMAMVQFPELFIDTSAPTGSNLPSGPDEAYLQGMIYAIGGAVFLVAFAVSFLLGRGKFAWTYNLVLICLGLTSCCCLPTNIPLLIYWIRADCKRWYFHTDPSVWE